MSPTTPHAAAGMRIDPPVSVPSEAKHIPSCSATAAPELEPPAERVAIERILHGTEGRFIAGGAERKLVEIGLADQHRAGLTQPLDDRCVATWPARRHCGPGGRGRAGDVDQILHRHRDPVKRTAVLARSQSRARRPSRPPAALSAMTVMNALSSRRASMRARQFVTSATGETSPRLTRGAISAMLRRSFIASSSVSGALSGSAPRPRHLHPRDEAPSSSAPATSSIGFNSLKPRLSASAHAAASQSAIFIKSSPCLEG